MICKQKSIKTNFLMIFILQK